MPGIGGSFLKEPDATFRIDRWPGLATNHDHLTLDPNLPSYNIIATDAIRRVSLPIIPLAQQVYGPMLERLVSDGGFREYQLPQDSALLPGNGCDLAQKSSDPNRNPTLFVFPYDWRKSNNDNAIRLKNYVQCVREFYPDTEVDILAHSMGGLLSRRYILQNPGEHHVKKFTSVNTPWLGAPKAINILETGDFVPFVTNSTIKRLVEFFPGGHQLLPSRNYYDVSQFYPALPATKPFIEEGWDINNNGISQEVYEYEQQVALLDGLHPRSLPGTQESIFNETAFVGGNKPQDWRNDTTGVEYHHIISRQKSLDTIGAVRAVQIDDCAVLPGPVFTCIPLREFQTTLTEGDGTVPFISLERGWSKGGAANLNHPDATLWYNWPLAENDDGMYEHTGALHHQKIQDLILYLTERRLAKPDYPRLQPGELGRVQSPSNFKHSAQQTKKRQNSRANHSVMKRSANMPQTNQRGFGAPPPPPSPSYYFSIRGVDYVSVTDAQGNTNTRLDDLFMQPVPNVSYHPIGENSFTIVTNTTQTYTMKFQVGTLPLALEIIKGIGNTNPMTATRYKDLSLPAGVMAQLVITPQGPQNLRYDADGDGVFETVVAPTVNLTGAAARDVTAPIITANATIQGAQTQVALTAADAATGVKMLLYSTDGATFRPYTAPLTLDPAQTPTLYAFADDNAANRSSVFIYKIPLGISGLVTNAQDNALAGVNVTLAWTVNNAPQSFTAQTGNDGRYLFPNLLRGVNYTVTPARSGLVFLPATQTATSLAGNRVFNFTVDAPSGNAAPDISQARPSTATLWPPNHGLVGISILGVTDPDNDPVTIRIDQIKQDEPTNGTGDGDTCPDAAGIGTTMAQVRAERKGNGNGRVYTIYFTASDGSGGSASGNVKVKVPKNPNSSPIDDGPTYLSTTCP